MTYAVYGIKNIHNGRIYVGSSKNLKSRLRLHFSLLRKGSHKNRKIQKDFNRYGEDAFEVVHLSSATSEKSALKFEQIYIDGFENTYNILQFVASAKGRVYTEVTLQRMRDAAKGRVIPPEQIEKIAATLRGTKASEEHKRNISKGIKQFYENGGVSVANKLNKVDVYEIHRRLKLGHDRHQIAADFNVSYSNIGHIAQGGTWRRIYNEVHGIKAELPTTL